MVAGTSKPRLSEREIGKIEGLLLAGQSHRYIAKAHKHSRNIVAAIAKKMNDGGDGNGRRTDMDWRTRNKKAKRATPYNNLRRTILRLANIREEQVYYTGKKQKRGVRIAVPYGTAPRIRQKLIMLRNNRLDEYKKLPREQRLKKEQSEHPIPSVRAIQRHLNVLNLKPLVRPRVPFTPENIERRLKFVSKPEYADPNYCKRICFSDEHYVSANDNSNRFQWVASRKDLVPREVKSKHNVYNSQLWAMVGYNYKSPIIWIDFKNEEAQDEEHKRKKEEQKKLKALELKRKKAEKTNKNQKRVKKAPPKSKYVKKGRKPTSLKQQQKKNPTRLNGSYYIDKVLKNKEVYKKLKDSVVVFMQDGATSHKCIKTKQWLTRQKINFIDDWPAHSPDLNPIEQLWAELNRRISENQRKVPSSVEELRRMTEQEWDALPLEVVNKYVLSFHAKCARCKQNKGGSAKL